MYLDSAASDEVALAASLGYVRGVTVNPTLMARAGAADDPLRHLGALRALLPGGMFFYQPCSVSPNAALGEAWAAFEQNPDHTVIKIPAVSEYFSMAVELVGRGVRVAMTGVYGGSQAALAGSVGADWVIPYVDRAARLLGHDRLVTELASILVRPVPDRKRSRILAASVKSVRQAEAALLDGADEVSVPVGLLTALASHELSRQALEEFQQASRYTFVPGVPDDEQVPRALRG
ncbi:transaldolase [Frankia torreyi]|uniref:Transaldolase n=1 Tax=Frankia torreyi TaxID=1856 RepID=A0A0D8B6G1_9ACTN|nr:MULTISPECIES: transaldolase family protein [Frankia]KJE19519.1 transaldolase [Frankia torreyi]